MKHLIRQRVTQQMPYWQEVPESLRQSVSIPEHIRQVREVLGMTQAQLAERAGMTQSAIANIENNPTADLQLSTIEKIAKALDCNLLLAVVPQEEISKKLEECSKVVAQKLIRVSSGNAALEMQLPDSQSVALSVENMQKDLLENHRKWLWEKI